MLDLFALLPEKDKELMEKYINLYGVGKEDFIGLKEYLKYWAESKKKLYKLFGDKFQVEIPYSYEKTNRELNEDGDKLRRTTFHKEFSSFLLDNFNSDDRFNIMAHLHCADLLLCDNKVTKLIEFESPKTGKKVKITAGTKAMRAYAKFAEHFNEVKEIYDEYFEEFRLVHSMILNDKIIHGTLVLSIHPFDFITMSDNGSNWSSCMNWTDNGCYHIGTIEMMNSNNVICAYLKGSEDWCFDLSSKKEKDKTLMWNNKKWRQLFYVTKDIIVSGKAYPYPKKETSIACLDKIKQLAEENVNWNYTYGPELYKDMIHISSIEAMNRNKAWLANGESTKHNIIFDTKGMYNDMLNDSSTNYWCYRNKVPKMKIISYSGKAPCACCGNDALELSSYWEDYNDRYDDPERIVCSHCHDDGICEECYSFKGKNTLIKVNGKRVCKTCYNTVARLCPCCNEIFIVSTNDRDELPAIRLSNVEKLYHDDYHRFNREYFNIKYFKNHVKNKKNELEKAIPFSDLKILPAYMCEKCLAEKIKDGFFEEKKLPASGNLFVFQRERIKIVSKKSYTVDEILTNPEVNKFLIHNLREINEENNSD